jgi:hypothetical protein
LDATFRSPFLNKGVMRFFFQSDGTVPESSDVWKTRTMAGANSMGSFIVTAKLKQKFLTTNFSLFIQKRTQPPCRTKITALGQDVSLSMNGQ